MKENIEEDIEILKSIIKINNDYLKGIEIQTINQKEIKALEHILSDYKRVLKENELARKALIENCNIADERNQLLKENEELNNRCRNLDKEAQAYLEELAGDNTLTRRTIKQLQEENEECKLDVQDYLKQAQENAEMYRKAQKKIQDLKAENEELKDRIREHTMLISPYYVKENYIPKTKIEEILNNGEYTIIFEGDADFADEATCIDAQKYIKLEKLQELVEERK